MTINQLLRRVKREVLSPSVPDWIKNLSGPQGPPVSKFLIIRISFALKFSDKSIECDKINMKVNAKM